jgi:ornithine cyclodeaminase/alanine dehydrogenase-like protein (mu-crystallin family)
VYRILTDDDINRLLPMDRVIETIEKSLRAKTAGQLVAPPRFSVGVEKGALLFTAGAELMETHTIGFRVYDSFQSDAPGRTELAAVFESRTGAFKGLCVGVMIGALRTAAINAIAIKYMSRPDVRRLGILGPGLQARTHFQAAVLVRQFDNAMVYSPTARHRQTFADELGHKTGVSTEALFSAEDVVRRAEVLICASTSTTPILDAGWLHPGMHINTIGPKYKGRHEFPVEAARKSHTIVTDSLQQVDGYESYAPPFFLQNTPERKRMIELDELVSDKRKGRSSPEDITLFCSVGLAATEVVLADAALQALSI